MTRVWKDRMVERPRTFTVQNNPDGTITLIPAPGIIIEPGTPINATILNSLELDLENASKMTDTVTGSKYVWLIEDGQLYIKEVAE